jgi:hypothetical protein
MHLDKKLITIIVSSALIGGIIGGGIGGAIGSFAGHEEGGRHRERGGMEQGGWQKDSTDSDTNEAQEGNAPQTGQVTNTAQPQTQVVSASTTKAK